VPYTRADAYERGEGEGERTWSSSTALMALRLPTPRSMAPSASGVGNSRNASSPAWQSQGWTPAARERTKGAHGTLLNTNGTALKPEAMGTMMGHPVACNGGPRVWRNGDLRVVARQGQTWGERRRRPKRHESTKAVRRRRPPTPGTAWRTWGARARRGACREILPPQPSGNTNSHCWGYGEKGRDACCACACVL